MWFVPVVSVLASLMKPAGQDLEFKKKKKKGAIKSVRLLLAA